MRYYCELYKKHKDHAVALDIETESIDGPISVLSLCKQHPNGSAETVQFAKHPALPSKSIATELRTASLILTYNGLKHDLPKLKAEQPGALPVNTPVLDLLLLAQAIGLHGSLKTLERVLGIARPNEAASATGRTHHLWRQYQLHNDQEALEQLLSYAAADVRNLFALADALVEWAEAKLLFQETRATKPQFDASTLSFDLGSFEQALP